MTAVSSLGRVTPEEEEDGAATRLGAWVCSEGFGGDGGGVTSCLEPPSSSSEYHESGSLGFFKSSLGGRLLSFCLLCTRSNISSCTLGRLWCLPGLLLSLSFLEGGGLLLRLLLWLLARLVASVDRPCHHHHDAV